MNKRKFYITIMILSLLLNVILLSICIIERNSDAKVRRIWDLGLKNAIFDLEQYDENNLQESYNYAIADLGTMANTIAYINNIDENEVAYFGALFQNIVSKPEIMKLYISDIRNILELLKENNDKAFTKIQELNEIVGNLN